MALNANALIDVQYASRHGATVSTGDDAEAQVEDLINVFSSMIQRRAGRQWQPAQTAATKLFRYDGLGVLRLAAQDPPTELSAVTSITLYSDQPTANQIVLSPGDSTGEADYRLEPRQKTAEGTWTWLVLPFASPTGLPATTSTGLVAHLAWESRASVEVQIVGDWGAGTVPAEIQMACAREVANAMRNPEGYATRSLGEMAFSEGVDIVGGPWPPLSRGTLRLVDEYRVPVFA